MMDYEVFKNVVTARIKEFLPPIYRNFNAEVHRVPKINGMREAMIVSLEMDDCRMSGPNIYLDELYERFIECGEMDSIMKEAAQAVIAFTGMQHLGERGAVKLQDYRGNVVQMLINTEMNRDLLETAPHKEFFDLSIIYRIAVPDEDGKGYATALVTNEMMEELGVTAEELDRLAEENSRRDLKTQLFPMTTELTMMTTEAKMYGAVNLLRMDEIKKVSEKMNANLYILPSSVHDLMVIRENEMTSEITLFAMLKDGNETCNDPDENLSYNIYYYDREKNALDIKYYDK